MFFCLGKQLYFYIIFSNEATSMTQYLSVVCFLQILPDKTL